tara:strand:+ start:176 stop:487 length:312 start_codon:yes stop_codon:yes gene_type:complete
MFKQRLYVSSTLSVSQVEPLDCLEMAKYLSKNGISTSITSNISCQPHLEYGCRLTQPISSKQDITIIWEKLQKKYDFTCGHIKVGDIFDGCVKDFLNPSNCLS